ncbi:alpha/beta hydrolase [Winogradskyella haliclonae]|uniref:Esterase n=1 Tax=Winogradskyella haliclonae TaxID=2048558 RepID=A0ABQ2BTQ6_9FLAO|nr:alpha/beta hydrolase-fold protein [Winogradskyella haliclonae]GGI55830.1 esterase [Winogradskyella haliclonae]
MKQTFVLLAFILSFTATAQITNDIKFQKLDSAILFAGSLHRVEAFPSKFIKPRPVDVWLPENYSKDKKYAVLYMHDGQNLFDATTTWNKQEWMVDEWSSKMMEKGITKDFIVVAIHNIPQIRWQDLYPEKAMSYMNEKVRDSLITLAKKSNFNVDFKGDEYLSFIAKELKPVIDKQYAVYTDKANTFVGGSSMGGLMSMYAVAEYPDVFGGAACLSTHWPGAMPAPNNPHPKAIFDYMKENLPNAGMHKLYFDYGNKTLDQYYPKYAPNVDAILKAKGYTDSDSKNLFFEGTNHSEQSWNKRLDKPLLFLLGK